MRRSTNRILFILSAMFFVVSCRQDHDKSRMLPDVWETTPYIPAPSITSGCAELGLESACLLRFKNGDIGYVCFQKADRWHAMYESSLIIISNAAVRFSCMVSNKLVTTKTINVEAPVIYCGDARVRWLPPTTIFFSEEIVQAAIEPIERLKAGNFEFTNTLSWSVVHISVM